MSLVQSSIRVFRIPPLMITQQHLFKIVCLDPTKFQFIEQTLLHSPFTSFSQPLSPKVIKKTTNTREKRKWKKIVEQLNHPHSCSVDSVKEIEENYNISKERPKSNRVLVCSFSPNNTRFSRASRVQSLNSQQ